MRRSLQIFILKVNQSQTLPLIFIKQTGHSDKNLIIGSLTEPTSRFLALYRINPFQDENLHLFTRSDVECFEGFTEYLLQSVARGKYLGLVAFSPSMICSYIERLKKLVGARFLFFAGYELLTNKYKLGVTKKEQFFELCKDGRLDIGKDGDLDNLNQYMRENTKSSSLFDPSSLISEDGTIIKKPFKIYPIKCGSNNLINYLVETNQEQKWNHEKVGQSKFPLTMLPELKKYGFVEWLNVIYKREDYLLNGIQYLHLILDLKQKEVSGFDLNRLTQLIQLKQSEEKLEILYIIHLQKKESLISLEYEELVSKIEKISEKIKICHIIVDDQFYHNDGSTKFDTDKLIFGHLQVLIKFSTLMPQVFKQPLNLDYLHEKTSNQQMNLDDLWPSLKTNKLLNRKTYCIHHFEDNNITFEKSYKLGQSNFMITNEESQLISNSYHTFLDNVKNVQKGRLRLEFHGVSATVPTLMNNVQSFCLKVGSSFRILIDCGQNTYFQLMCMHGDQLEKVLQDIRVIAISHFHSDHHLGLTQILSKIIHIIEKKNQGPIVIFLPQNLIHWYEAQFKVLINQHFPEKNVEDFIITINNTEYSELSESHYGKKIFSDQNLQFVTFPVVHCFFSNGFKVIDLETKKTICFSSDHDGNFLSNDRLYMMQVKDCDILVHECTYPDFELARAKQVNHSTFTQAIKQGISSGAKNLILTHYSTSCLKQIQDIINIDGSINDGKYRNIYKQHYQQIGSHFILDYIKNQTVFAQDFMGVDVNEVSHMPHLSRLITKHSSFI